MLIRVWVNEKTAIACVAHYMEINRGGSHCI